MPHDSFAAGEPPLPKGPHRRPQLSDEAASYVRDQITSGNLPPGARVRPEAVAAELGTSSTPAREALQALRAEGFLNLSPRRGFTVAPITGDDIRDTFLVQAQVAGEIAARVAQRATPELLARLEGIHADLTAAAERGDLNALEELNHEFHQEINRASGAPKLAWVIKLVARYVPRRFYATIEGWPQTTIDDHSGVIDAIRAGDAKRARREMSEHIRHAGEQLAQHVEASQISPRDND